jgi:transposase
VRVTTLLNRLLAVPGISVLQAGFPTDRDDVVEIDIKLRRGRWLHCPCCDYRTRSRYDTRPVLSRWRSLDLGRWRVQLRAQLRRLCCPQHGVHTEAVPFARYRSDFTHDFEALTAVLATRTDKSTIARLLRIDWDTVGRICARVITDELDPARLDNLVNIGVDEVSWKPYNHFLTVVVDHDTRRVVWGGPGRNTEALNAFFTELGPHRAGRLQAISTDMGAAYLASIATHAPQATLCTDPFHAVRLVTKALDRQRRQVWNELRRTGDRITARVFQGARWALLKNPTDLNTEQARWLRQLKRHGGDLWRAYTLKEAFRAIFIRDYDPTHAPHLIDRWISRAQRSRLPEFVRVAKTIRTFRDTLTNAINLNINNGRVEALNTVIRLITKRARGFHTWQAALALVMLTCGPVNLRLPHEDP